MSAVRLETLSGYRPLAKVSDTADYTLKKRGPEGPAVPPTTIPIPPEMIFANALRNIDRLREQQGYAEYVAGLLSNMEDTAGNRLIFLEFQPQTHLTTLLAEQYGVAVDQLTYQEANLRLAGQARPDELLQIDYQIYREPPANTFWGLDLNGRYGFVNLTCYGGSLAMPLEGSGNIAFVPGVQEALTADVAMLTAAASSK